MIDNHSNFTIPVAATVGTAAGIVIGETANKGAKKILNGFVNTENKDWFEKAAEFAKEQGDFADKFIKEGNFKGKFINGEPVICGLGSLGSKVELNFTKKGFEKVANFYKNKGRNVAIAAGICGAIGIAVGALINHFKNKDNA